MTAHARILLILVVAADGKKGASSDMAYVQAMCPLRLADNAGGARCTSPKKKIESFIKP